MSTDPFDRLPKWAQQHITNLERRVARLESAASVGPEDSDTFAAVTHELEKPLGAGTRIRFDLPGGRQGTLRDHIDARTEDDTLVIVGSDTFQVLPSSSNLVRVRIGR